MPVVLVWISSDCLFNLSDTPYVLAHIQWNRGESRFLFIETKLVKHDGIVEGNS